MKRGPREREPRALRIASVALLLANGLGGCASPSMQAGSSAPADDASLACALPTNCIASSEVSAYLPLVYAGPPEQALALLHEALAAFPDAEIVGEDGASLTAIFTTPAGFGRSRVAAVRGRAHGARRLPRARQRRG